MLIDPETKKKNPIKSGYTKIKVAIGYILLLSLLFSLVFITYNSFYNIIDSVESLSNNKNESALIKNIALGIDDIRTSSKVYSIKFRAVDYKAYLDKTEAVSTLIDSLDLQLTRKKEFNKADSLNAIFGEYITSINKWLKLKRADNTDDLGKISEIIQEQDDSLIHSPNNIPHSTTTTVTRFLEKPVGEDSLEALNAAENSADKTFFQKIFGSRKKSKDNQLSKVKVNQKIITQTSVEVDTSYYNQVDALLSKVKKTLSNTENTNNLRKTQLARLEILLLNYQSDLISKIDFLLKQIEDGDQAFLDKKISTSKQTAKKASRILLYAELIALIISLVFMYVIFRDLTRSAYYKRMLEKEKLETEKLARTKEEFLTMMSHEIRAPLTNIVGLTEQLDNGSHASRQQQINSIVNSSEHLLSIVNDFLDYSKIEYGSLTFEKIGFYLNDIIAEVIDILKLKADRKKIKLIYQPEDRFEHLLFSGDPVRLKQILINLIGNGIKFTDKGHIKIETSVTEIENGYLLHCSVIDTGIGIEKDKIENIFTDFTQADSSITRKYGGTGLGLSICKKIVEMQEGSISVKSEFGKGSIFSFEIPYQKASENEYNPKTDAVYGEQLKNKRILVIDDDEMMPMLLEPMMRNWHVNYSFCIKPLQAWKWLQEKEYDLIMLDMQMSEMDGFELLRRIKTDNSSKNKNAKTVICTANVALDINDPGLTGNSLILFKPFKKAELWTMMCKSLDIPEPIQYISVSDEMSGKNFQYSLNNLKTYANEDPDTLVLFITTFISQTKTELREMKKYFIEQNYRQVREIAHKLKNTFGQLEIHELLAILISMESQVQEDRVDPGKMEQQILTLEQSSSGLFNQLEQEIQSLVKN